jgi:hypothetical protein
VKIIPKIELSDSDLSHVLNLCGHFSRTTDSEGYQKLVPMMREAVHNTAQAAFNAGRDYERKQAAE